MIFGIRFTKYLHSYRMTPFRLSGKLFENMRSISHFTVENTSFANCHNVDSINVVYVLIVSKQRTKTNKWK